MGPGTLLGLLLLGMAFGAGLRRMVDRGKAEAAPETQQQRSAEVIEKLVNAILIVATKQQVDLIRLRVDDGLFRVVFERDDESWEEMRPPAKLARPIIERFEALIGCELVLRSERIRPVLRYGAGTDLLQIEVHPAVPWARKWRSGKKLAPLPQA